MEIYLIRHTTPKIEKGICYGQSDILLDENFETEFKNIENLLPGDYTKYKVYTSPLERCKLLAKKLNSQINEDERLKELDFGFWELSKWDDIPDEELTPWMKDFTNVKIPNGESYVDLASRVNECLTQHIKTNTDNLIIVTHAGPIRAFLATLLQIPLKKSFNIKVSYGSIFHINRTNNKLSLISKIDL